MKKRANRLAIYERFKVNGKICEVKSLHYQTWDKPFYITDSEGVKHHLEAGDEVDVLPPINGPEKRTPFKRPVKRIKKCTNTFIQDEMEATRHPADGKHYTSKSKFRAATKAHGCEEVGTAYEKGFGFDPDRDFAKVDEAGATRFAEKLIDNIRHERRVKNGRFEN